MQYNINATSLPLQETNDKILCVPHPKDSHRITYIDTYSSTEERNFRHRSSENLQSSLSDVSLFNLDRQLDMTATNKMVLVYPISEESDKYS